MCTILEYQGKGRTHQLLIYPGTFVLPGVCANAVLVQNINHLNKMHFQPSVSVYLHVLMTTETCNLTHIGQENHFHSALPEMLTFIY